MTDADRPSKAHPEAAYAAEWRRLDETITRLGKAHTTMLQEHEQEVERLRAALRRAEQAVVSDGDLARLLAQRLSGTSARIVEADVRAIIVLLALAETDQTVHDLRDALRLPQATTSEWIEQAVQRGWVTRSLSAKDKRVTTLRVTAKGLRSLRKAQRQDADMSPDGAEE